MSLIYIFAASPMEAEPVRKIGTPSSPDSHFRCGENELVLITGGMGPRNAREKADLTFRSGYGAPSGRKPDVAMTIGLCGGLIDPMKEGAVVTYEECLSTEDHNQSLSCSGVFTDSLMSRLKASDIRCDRVIGITSSRIAINQIERSMLANRGAVVVDMESFSILEVAASANVPVVILRVVSDSVDRKLPDFNRALDARGGLDSRKALRVALASPWSTAKLLAANRRAMRALTEALQVILSSRCFEGSVIH